jgi:hypothetical protein
MENDKTPEEGGPLSIRNRIPLEVRFLFFRVPALNSDLDLYCLLLAGVINELRPKHFTEWLLVRDIVDDVFYILFLRRIQIDVIDLAKTEALKSILKALAPEAKDDELRGFQKGWYLGMKISGIVKKLIDEYNIGPNMIDAEAVRLRSDDLKKIDSMIASRESRLSKAHRELDLYRERIQMREQLKGKSEPKQLPFIQPSELSDDKRDPAQKEGVNQTATIND